MNNQQKLITRIGQYQSPALTAVFDAVSANTIYIGGSFVLNSVCAVPYVGAISGVNLNTKSLTANTLSASSIFSNSISANSITSISISAQSITGVFRISGPATTPGLWFIDTFNDANIDKGNKRVVSIGEPPVGTSKKKWTFQECYVLGGFVMNPGQNRNSSSIYVDDTTGIGINESPTTTPHALFMINRYGPDTYAIADNIGGAAFRMIVDTTRSIQPDTVYAGRFTLDLGSLSSGQYTPTNNFGIVSEVNHYGTLTAVETNAGFFRINTLGGGGNINQAKVIKVGSPLINSGPITNMYGLYIDPLTGAINNWAIYTSGGTTSYFGGKIGINTLLPTEGLSVSGNISVTGSMTANTISATKFIGDGGSLSKIATLSGTNILTQSNTFNKPLKLSDAGGINSTTAEIQWIEETSGEKWKLRNDTLSELWLEFDNGLINKRLHFYPTNLTTISGSLSAINGSISANSFIGLSGTFTSISADTIRVSSTNNQLLTVGTGTSISLLVVSGGNVGVGVDIGNPAHKLVVSGGNSLIVGSLPYTTSGRQGILYIGDTNVAIKAEFGYGLKIDVAGFSEALNISENSGNVGIGLTAASAKLHVNGSISANSISATTDIRATTFWSGSTSAGSTTSLTISAANPSRNVTLHFVGGILTQVEG